MQKDSSPRFHLPELDGLRFVAFLLVFIHNAPNIGSLRIWTALHDYGWIGVDLFFCLSGFLITRLLVMEYQRSGGIDIRRFYVRRILRIWPLYYSYIALGLLYIVATQGWLPVLPKHLAGLTTFTYDFVYLFLTYKVFAVYFHLWTISYEEQFYAVIPWVIRKMTKNMQGFWLVVVAASITGTLMRATLIYLNVKHPVVYMLPFTHFEAVIGGVAIGFGVFDTLLEKIQGGFFLLGGILLNAFVFLLPNTFEIGWSLMITYPLVGIGMTLIVIGISGGKPSLAIKILGTRSLVYLGKISFGLYMFHLLSLSMVIHAFQGFLGTANISPTTQQGINFVAGLLLTILLSIVSYNLLEKPFLKFKEKFVLVASRPI